MLYRQIGEEKIIEVVSLMYEKAFADGIIGHFFLGRDMQVLIKHQTDFLIGLFGGPKRYSGRDMAAAHKKFVIKNVHFQRRQQILRESLRGAGVDESLSDQWLKIEGRFKSVIINDEQECH